MIGPPPTADAEQNGRIDLLSRRLHVVAEQATVPFLSVFELLRQDSVWMEVYASGAPDELHLMARRAGMSWEQSAEYLRNFAEHVIPAVRDL
jgi:hypothetical protein